MSGMAEGIRETIEAARAMRAREDTLRAAVASGNGPAIIEAARAFFEDDDDDRRDCAPARVERGAGRS